MAAANGSKTKAPAQVSERLYVGNLAPAVDEFLIVTLFSKFGKIAKLDFLFHKSGPSKGRPRGYCFVEMSRKEEALRAMVELHDKTIRGRRLVVTLANESPYTEQGSGRTGPHRTPNASHHRPTTLSILKSQHAPKGRNNQIAALEAKLAMMEHAHPDDPRGSLSPSYLPQSRDDSPAMRDDAGPSGTSGPAADEDLSVDAFLDEATGDVDSPEAPEPEKALSLLMPAGLGLPARPSAATIAAAEMLANQPAPRPPPNRVMPSAEVPPAALEPEPASGGGAGSISSSTSMPLPPLAQPQEEARRSPALPPPRGKPKNKGPSNRQITSGSLITAARAKKA